MAENPTQRKLTAILSADVKGYSKLMGEDDEATVKTITAYRQLISELIHRHHGRVVDTPGDNILAEFGSALNAVNGAIAIQSRIASENKKRPGHRRMEFRIGVNLGDILHQADRIYGNGVNVAARIESLADPGGICISRGVFDQVKNKIAQGFEYLGEHAVKNISEPVRIYRILFASEFVGRVIGEPSPRRTVIEKQTAVIITVLLICSGVAFSIFFSRFTHVEPALVENMAYPLPEKPSIAVLPFDNLSGDPDQNYIADGLTENIIDALSTIPEMFVVARNSTLAYKGKRIAVRQVAEDLGVHYVLEGSTQQAGERLRVTAQLIHALEGHHLWSEKYDRKLNELFAVQDEITLKIALEMELKLTEGEQTRMRHATDNLNAWRLVSKAKGLFENYRIDDNKQARELFRKAVRLDPNYAYAMVYLAWTHFVDGLWFSSHYNVENSFTRATEIAQKALQIDNRLSDAYAVLSFANLTKRKFDEAVAAGEQSIALGPNDSENHAIVAMVMEYLGDGQAAKKLLHLAMRLDPHYPPWYQFRLASVNRLLGRYEDCIAILENMKKTGKSTFIGELERGTTYAMMGRMEEATACVKRALELNPTISIESWGRGKRLYKDSAYTEQLLRALRKAGLPETSQPMTAPEKNDAGI